MQQQPPARLYPDLPGQPGVGLHQHQGGHHYPPNQGPTPFVPFGLSVPTHRFNGAALPGQPPMMMPPDQGPARQQTFVSGLGRRLMALIGMNSTSGEMDEASAMNRQPMNQQEMMRALQNSTILQQLNKGVNSVYGSLSKIYNSTVQQQLGLLQDRFRMETENSTNPWQQRMAQQVPQFFKQMSAKVQSAQEQLNQAWRQVSQQMSANGSALASPQQQNPKQQGGFFDQFMPASEGHMFGPDNFYDQISRSFDGWNSYGMNGGAGPDQHQNSLGNQLRALWHNQIQPQLGAMRGQMARVWRDLTASGALMGGGSETFRSRHAGSQSGANGNDSKSADFVDDVLRDIDMSGTEYTVIDAKADQGDKQQQPSRGSQQQQQQIQNNLMQAQRELNQLWNGLTSGLQNTLNRVKQMVNPPSPFNSAGPAEQAAAQADPAENELDGKLKNLTKLQREADTVYEVVRTQQQMQPQQRSFGDRFRNFFGNMESPEQMQNRLGDSLNRFGNVVGDLWNQIPTRWNNLMDSYRFPAQQQPQPDGPKQQIGASNGMGERQAERLKEKSNGN